MQCPKCHLDLPDDAHFCGGCGERFGEGLSQSQNTPNTDVSHPVTGEVLNPFEMQPKDFARALEIACQRAKKALPPGERPSDHATLNAAAEAAQLDKLSIEKALHRVSIEKLPAEQRKAMGVVLDDELPPLQKSKLLWVALGVMVVAVGLGGGAFALYDPTPPPRAQLKPQKGQIDAAALGAPVDAVAAAAQLCYAKALKHFVRTKARKTLAGDVVLTLRIDLEGQATASLGKDTLQSPKATDCMIAAVAAQTWPAAKVAPVDVDVPLAFTAK